MPRHFHLALISCGMPDLTNTGVGRIEVNKIWLYKYKNEYKTRNSTEFLHVTLILCLQVRGCNRQIWLKLLHLCKEEYMQKQFPINSWTCICDNSTPLKKYQNHDCSKMMCIELSYSNCMGGWIINNFWKWNWNSTSGKANIWQCIWFSIMAYGSAHTYNFLNMLLCSKKYTLLEKGKKKGGGGTKNKSIEGEIVICSPCH